MNGTNYRIRYRLSGESVWRDGRYIYDKTPLREVQDLAQDMVEAEADRRGSVIAETIVIARDENWHETEISRHTQRVARKPKKMLKKCPWCRQIAKTKKETDGFWYCGCFEGMCPVSPSTSGQETEEEAIAIWNSMH